MNQAVDAARMNWRLGKIEERRSKLGNTQKVKVPSARELARSSQPGVPAIEMWPTASMIPTACKAWLPGRYILNPCAFSPS